MTREADNLLARLHAGCILHPSRWSGDTHADLGGPVDEPATDRLITEAAEHIDRLEADLASERDLADQLAVALLVARSSQLALLDRFAGHPGLTSGFRLPQLVVINTYQKARR